MISFCEYAILYTFYNLQLKLINTASSDGFL